MSPLVKLCPYCRSPKVYLRRKLYEYPQLFGFFKVARPHASPRTAIIGIWLVRLFWILMTIFLLGNEESDGLKFIILLIGIFFFVTTLIVEPEIRKGREKRYYKCRNCFSEWLDAPESWKDVNAHLKVSTPSDLSTEEPLSFHRLALGLFSGLSILLLILLRWRRRS